MTPEAQRIAIAQVCGWIPYYEKGNTPWADNPEFYGPSGAFAILEDVPDYLNDLNAMQSAVLSQDENFIKMFSTTLSYRSSRTGKVFCQLTATDWAEDFLRTIGKWEAP